MLAPISRPGTVLSLRVPRQRVFTLDELVASGAVPAEGAALLGLVVRRRLAFLVSGGTGSGKTTLLNALLSLVGPEERLVLVEDASELRPDHGHVVALEARPAQHRGQPARSRCARWCARRCGCAPTGWWSARSAVPRSSTCSPR